MKPRAIVVDDDAPSASVVAKLLTRLNCEVVTCTDPQSAVELTLSGEVDVVSLDISMPRLDGYQVLALIRSHEYSRRLASVPVITVTGRVTVEDQADALARGFASHLGKPVMVDGLRLALARALTLRDELHRTRYTTDREAIDAAMCEVLDRTADTNRQAASGMALAMEQQGTLALYKSLLLALQGQAAPALRPLENFAGLAMAVGATRLSDCLDDMARHLGPGGDMLGTAAVLARAELDRVIFTLREQVHR